MQSLRFYDCEMSQRLLIQNASLSKEMVIENRIHRETLKPSQTIARNDSEQTFYVFHVTAETPTIQLEIVPHEPGMQYVIFLRHEQKPTEIYYNWTGLIPAAHSSSYSLVLAKEAIGRMGRYYMLLKETGENY